MTHSWRSVLASGVVCVALGSLAACGDSSAATEKSALAGRAFVAVSAEGLELPAGSNLQLAFDGLGVRMSGGCNSGSADYDVQDGVLLMQSMSITEMACEQPLMDLDAAVAGLLGAKPSVRLDGDELTIRSADTVLHLIDQRIAVPDRSLADTLWIVTTVLNADIATGGFGGTNATVRFVGDTVEVFAGCNRGSGTFTVSGTAIEFGPIAITRMACEQPMMELEFAVMVVLQGSVSYEIEGNQLTLLNRDAGLQLDAASDA